MVGDGGMSGVENVPGSGTAAVPYRSLSEPFLAALEALAAASNGAWWADVLADPDLLLAVRNRSLNVYYRGASLFRITPASEGVAAETHVKYLVRQRQAMTRLAADGGFGLDPAAAVWTRYEGPATLAEMKRAATPLAGLEKTGVHALVQANPNVVDVEVSLTGAPLDIAAEPDGAQAEVDAALQSPDADAGVVPKRQDRLDVASLEERGVADEAWLVFHEAKLAANPALRSKLIPAIVGQVERYRATLKHEADRLASSYPALCRDLVRLDTLRRTVRLARGLDVAALPQRDPLVAKVASGARQLRVDPEPRLVLFGFDADQRDGAVETITESLRSQHNLRVYAVGRPGKGTAAFRRPNDLTSSPV
ncbi:conserved hypothetical protein [Methylorubrum extorquens CM4]|jgi:hypothetical protein|uniref:Uncharacterized protein n=2 Tax=Methylorubrum extorquens TaxID=408 RepID=B7KQV4_METC4|nr:conserved hypothetical protein [Methylorubrum extorquens CM4]